ncbi:secretogranin-1 [Antrostomus carolinensis]|uniref:secretogranin-1 n=1 Tax=Antrostomus carolinensis TaxID=279965 RepID=UPI0010A98994|nr:secretogranin-1 [Antrostomus carolinensis]
MLVAGVNESVIISLLGVSAVPMEKDHTEEMVTRCIVEVLSNALSKPNAPPINPECKEILKKSSRNDRERSENKQLEVRHLKDPAEIEKHRTGSVEEEQSQAEEESKTYMKGSDEEKLAHEEGKSKEEEDGHHTPGQKERLRTEEKKHYQEMGKEEEKSYHSEEEESKESKLHDKELEQAALNKKSHSGGLSTEELPAGSDQRPVGRWHSEEGMQSPYKRIHEGEEAEEERSENYHHESKERDISHQQEREESDESEETEEEKQPYNPERYHGKHRMADSSEEKRGHGGEKEELAEESNTEETYLWDKRNHHQKLHEESEQQQQQHEEKSGYHERHGSEEVEEKRHRGQGSEEYRGRWQQSEASSEEENKRHRHSEESDEKWREERRRHDGSHEARRHHAEGRSYLGDESEEELDRYLDGESKERQHRAGGRYHLWDNEGEGLYARERQGQARRHYSTGDSVEQQRYLGNSEEEEEEEVEKKHLSSNQMENEEENMEEGRYTEREEYRSRLPAENEKRTVASYSSLYPLLWWKSRHFEKRDSAGEQLLEGKEEGRPTLNEKSLFPEYNDYDWWEKKQILSALNHERTEKKNLGKMNRYDMKRQYKMDQLAQLLNYRKKSAEFPELYNSGEDMKKRHVIRNDRGSLSQRPLTAEEEKELENLAAMDLELQKIAEKFNNNRRG